MSAITGQRALRDGVHIGLQSVEVIVRFCIKRAVEAEHFVAVGLQRVANPVLPAVEAAVARSKDNNGEGMIGEFRVSGQVAIDGKISPFQMKGDVNAIRLRGVGDRRENESQHSGQQSAKEVDS